MLLSQLIPKIDNMTIGQFFTTDLWSDEFAAISRGGNGAVIVGVRVLQVLCPLNVEFTPSDLCSG